MSWDHHSLHTIITQKDIPLLPTTAGVRKCWHFHLPSFWSSHHSVFLVLIYFKEDACSEVTLASLMYILETVDSFRLPVSLKMIFAFGWFLGRGWEILTHPVMFLAEVPTVLLLNGESLDIQKKDMDVYDIYTICMLGYI